MVDYQPLRRIPGTRKEFDHQYDLHQFTEEQSVFILYDYGKDFDDYLEMP